jgi:hypothetical protein
MPTWISFKRAARNIALSLIALGGSTPAALAAPPSQLLGNSIIVSWSNTRQQRDEKPEGGWTEFHRVQGNHKLMIYVSTAGRTFSRQVNTVAGRSGAMDQVGNSGSAAYPVRSASFSSQSMTVVGVTSGGARRIQIAFGPGFTSCTAQVMSGFEGGKTSIMLSPITKRKVETRSTEEGAASCTIQSGNVLGGTS